MCSSDLKISAFDLRSHKSETLNIESRFDYITLALSPNGIILLAANEDGEVHLISLVSKSVLHKLRVNRPVHALQFSPDGKQFAVAKENLVLIYRTPGIQSKEFSPFGLDRVLKGALDEVTTVKWSSDSKVVALGAKDNTTRLYPVREKYTNFVSYCLGGHSDPIVATFFEDASLACYTMSRNGQLVHWECSLEPSQLQKAEIVEVKKKDDDEEDNIEDEVGNVCSKVKYWKERKVIVLFMYKI